MCSFYKGNAKCSERSSCLCLHEFFEGLGLEALAKLHVHLPGFWVIIYCRETEGQIFYVHMCVCRRFSSAMAACVSVFAIILIQWNRGRALLLMREKIRMFYTWKRTGECAERLPGAAHTEQVEFSDVSMCERDLCGLVLPLSAPPETELQPLEVRCGAARLTFPPSEV